LPLGDKAQSLMHVVGCREEEPPGIVVRSEFAPYRPTAVMAFVNKLPLKGIVVYFLAAGKRL
jgi:hypothetical protein